MVTASRSRSKTPSKSTSSSSSTASASKAKASTTPKRSSSVSARSAAAAPAPQSGNVWLWWPNIIGYVRVLLLAASLYLAFSRHRLAVACYFLSFVLDAADGWAARRFNQSSTFGAVLDMVTDRSATSAWLIILGAAYPDWAWAFGLLVSLDVSSHYFHMYASLISKETSHKNVGKDSNILLRLYYTNRYVLGAACAGPEVLYLSLFLMKYEAATCQHYYFYAAVASVPLFVFKQVMNVIQLHGAMAKTIAHQFAKN